MEKMRQAHVQLAEAQRSVPDQTQEDIDKNLAMANQVGQMTNQMLQMQALIENLQAQVQAKASAPPPAPSPAALSLGPAQTRSVLC